MHIMASSLISFSMTLGLCFVSVFSASDQCVALKGGMFEACSITGYNQTFAIPYKLSSGLRVRLQGTIKSMVRSFKNCSVGGIAETMSCSYLAPYCKNGKTVLPCRRVCSEFLKRCSGSFPAFFVDLVIAMCTILPNSTSSEGKCYEPPNFIEHHNASSEGPLERKCVEIIIPFCQNMGYPLTMITKERQMEVYKTYYGKNYTEGDKDIATPAAGSSLQKAIYFLGNHSSCAENIKKLWCSDVIQPCFVGEGLGFYTVCRNVCLSIAVQCPSFIDRDFEYFMYCERMAVGNATLKNGYCKHTSWPPPMKWIDYYKDRPYPVTKKKGGIGGAIIAVIVVVPVIIAGVTIGLVYYFKTRKLTSKGYSRQEDDKTDLVT